MIIVNLMIYLSAFFSTLFALLALIQIIYSFYVRFFPNHDWNSNYKIKKNKQKYSIKIYLWMVFGFIITYSMVLIIPIYYLIKK